MHFEPELSAFLDGELGGEQARAVAAHVDACPECAAAVDRLRAVGGVLRRWDAEETRYATTNAFRARVLSDLGAEESAAPPRAASARPRLVLIRAAAAALVIVSLGAGYSMVRPPDRGTDLAQVEEALLRVLQERNAKLDAASATDASAQPSVTDPGWTERLAIAPWGTVVTPREDTSPVAPREAAAAPEVFEEHGDVRILQDAFPHWDRVQRELRELALREDFLRLKADRIAATDRPTTDEIPVTPLGRHLGALRVAAGEFAPYQQVQVWPIVRSGADGDGDEVEVPLPVDTALDVSALRVTEGSQADSIFLENTDRRGRSVLVLAGDVFHGGRRDRVAMEDVLLLPGQERHVRALGTGETHRRGRTRFSRSDGLAPQRVRALIAQGVDQTMLDHRVADVLPHLGLASGNGSLDEIFGNDQLLSRADVYVRALSQRLDGRSVVGFAVAAGGDLLGVEVFPDHGAFSAMRSRVLRSYVIEALARPRLVGEPPATAAVTSALRTSSRVANVGTSMGGTFGAVAAFVDPDAGIGGYGLLDRGHLVHAVIFDGDGLGASSGAGGRGRPGALEAAGGPTDLGEGTGPDTGPTRGDASTDSGVGNKR